MPEPQHPRTPPSDVAHHLRAPSKHEVPFSGPLRVVVTGTGTGVGKTYVSCALLSAWRERGLRCLGLKPAETGYVEPHLSDAQALADAAGHRRLTPCFTSPVPASPHRVARLAGEGLTADRLRRWVCAQVEARPAGLHLVETAGGLFTPISESETNLDVVRALSPCIFVLVAADRLGVLHDVNAARWAAAAQHRAPDVIWLNRTPGFDPELHNDTELRSLDGMPPVVTGAAQSAELANDLLTRLFISVR